MSTVEEVSLMLTSANHSVRPGALTCPHCGSTRILSVHWDWDEEDEDRSVAPRCTVWECLDCCGFFTTNQ